MTIIADGTVEFGLQLPIQAQSSMFVADWETRSGPAELAKIAQTADAAGFFYAAVCDHIAIPHRLAPAMGTTWYDPISTLAWLAGITQRIRLMTHVWVAAYRHPMLSAKAFSTLDHLSGGRVICGVGAGHVAEEFAALGIDFASRGKLLDEAIAALRVAFAEEFPTFDGPTWLNPDGGARPRPAQAGGPPIWIGGSSPAALRRTGEVGDGWLPQGTPRGEMAAQIATIRSHRDRVGGEPVELGAISEFLYVGTPSWDVGRGVVAGEPARLAESMQEFADLGVSHIQVRFKARSCDELCDQVRAFGAEVAPLVKR